ncbi:CYTH domain-containing protein [Neobacillus sp. FSL H8-0543]|uniref:CYTH domain-containing protein n=1 Tax=Neobacillus sp. FSL H8-0543 TaxID=2954672 RepID=UPI003158BDFC
MSETIEIEFKNMLTKSEYEKLLDTFKITETQIFSQENHYFDTPDFALKHKESALRIRVKENIYEMTLKQPHQIGLLETTQILNEEEFSAAIKNGILPRGIIYDRLTSMAVSFTDVEYFGSLVTKRVEIPYKNGLLVFDHSLYLNKEDYELEYEAQDYHLGQQIFLELLNQHTIPQRTTENKIRRFYRHKKKITSNY